METQASMWKGVASTLQAILLGQVSAKVESHDQSINKSLSSGHKARHMQGMILVQIISHVMLYYGQ